MKTTRCAAGTRVRTGDAAIGHRREGRRPSRRAALCIASLAMSTTFAAPPPPRSPHDAATVHARTLAASCNACHAAGGPPDDSRLHPLDGLSEAALLATLRSYRASDRRGDVMVQLTKGYSDAQLVEIAAALAAGASKVSP